MTQYLIRTLTDSTGHTFTHVTQARDNEMFTVVDAESKEDAKSKYKAQKLNEAFTKSKSPDPTKWLDNYRSISKPVPNRNQAIPPRKDSE